jgi:hypothetical protein
MQSTLLPVARSMAVGSGGKREVVSDLNTEAWVRPALALAGRLTISACEECECCRISAIRTSRRPACGEELSDANQPCTPR